MKLKRVLAAAMAVVLALALSVTAFATEEAPEISVQVDGQTLTFNEFAPELNAESGRTFLPFRQVFEALGCAGVARIDYLLDGENDDRVYVNEINTIPGSLAFYLWEATGVPYKELLDRLVGLALRRARRRGNLMFTYDTNILSMGGFGAKGCKK